MSTNSFSIYIYILLSWCVRAFKKTLGIHTREARAHIPYTLESMKPMHFRLCVYKNVFAHQQNNRKKAVKMNAAAKRIYEKQAATATATGKKWNRMNKKTQHTQKE